MRHNLVSDRDAWRMKSIIDPKLLERLRVGPLAQYFDPYLARLEEEGFSPSSVPCQAYAITRYSKWLQEKHITFRHSGGGREAQLDLVPIEQRTF